MNKLDEIIETQWSKIKLDLPEYEINLIKKIALEFAKHILEEAAENVEIDDYDEHMQYSPYVNKKSITDTLNKYL